MEYMLKKITGRYKEIDEKTLNKMRMEMKYLLKSWGAEGPYEIGRPIDADLPLWVEVEFLDNIIQFELECNPFLLGEVVN